MLGQQRRTRLVAPYFPLEFYDTLRFEKVILSFFSSLTLLVTVWTNYFSTAFFSDLQMLQRYLRRSELSVGLERLDRTDSVGHKRRR